MFFVLSNELYPFFFRNSDMQCYDKVTGIFIGTRKCRYMHVQGGINAVDCSNKGNSIWTCTSQCDDRAAPICYAPLVKESGQGDTQTPFSKITRISSIALSQNNSLFQDLRVHFLTLVFP